MSTNNFATPNKFCMLSKNHTLHLFLMDKYQAGWNIKQNYLKIHACFTLYFHFEGTSHISLLPVLSFLVLHQLFCQVIFLFLKLFRTSFNMIWKNIFVTNFSFSLDSPKSPHLFNNQNLENPKNQILFIDTALNNMPPPISKNYFMGLSTNNFCHA